MLNLLFIVPASPVASVSFKAAFVARYRNLLIKYRKHKVPALWLIDITQTTRGNLEKLFCVQLPRRLLNVFSADLCKVALLSCG
jgi:hypothetical protein